MDINFLIFLGFSVIVLGVSYVLFRNIPKWIDYLFDRVPLLNKVNKTLAHFLADSFGITLVVMAIVYFILLLPENASFVAVLLTIASGAFIFISEGWFGDALAGISLQLFPQYQVDDWVTLTDNQRGRVKRLGLFRTELVTIELDVISIKNGEIIAKNIINHSGIPLRRVDIIAHTADYGVFGDDIHAYKKAVLKIAEQAQDKVCPDARETGHLPAVLFTEFGASSDHIHVIFFTYDRDDLYGIALDTVHTALAAELRPKGVVLGQVNANTLLDGVLSFRKPKRKRNMPSLFSPGNNQRNGNTTIEWVEKTVQNIHKFLVTRK
ncbi:MAG: mechanosensitive ion channel family protein [Chloroflexi bacterium]|nr:mechanosensitive ion channel family protein [Chloroflexota bacterium]